MVDCPMPDHTSGLKIPHVVKWGSFNAVLYKLSYEVSKVFQITIHLFTIHRQQQKKLYSSLPFPLPPFLPGETDDRVDERDGEMVGSKEAVINL